MIIKIFTLLTYWLPVTDILFVKVRICRNLFKYNYLENKKLFLDFLLNLWNQHHILKILKTKITLTTDVFPKNLLRQMSKRPRFRKPCDSQRVKWSQTLVKNVWQHFYQISTSLWAKMTWKISLLVICESLGHFDNTLNAADNYSLPNSDNF